MQNLLLGALPFAVRSASITWTGRRASVAKAPTKLAARRESSMPINLSTRTMTTFAVCLSLANMIALSLSTAARPTANAFASSGSAAALWKNLFSPRAICCTM